MEGDQFAHSAESSLLPILQTCNGVNTKSLAFTIIIIIITQKAAIAIDHAPR